MIKFIFEKPRGNNDSNAFHFSFGKKNFSSDVMFREFFDVKHQILLSVKIFATFIYFVSELSSMNYVL